MHKTLPVQCVGYNCPEFITSGSTGTVFMRITCPQCDAEYDLPNVTSDTLQNNMQCSRCQHKFLPNGDRSQSAMSGIKPARRIVILPSATFENHLLKNNQGRPDLLKKAQKIVTDHQDDAKPADIPTIAIDDELKIKNLSDEAFEFVSMDNADRISGQRRPAFRDKWWSIAAVVGAILIFGGGLVVRDRVVSVIPSLASLYKLAGITVNSRGLEFTSVKTKTELKNDENILIVEGMIKNVSGDSVDIPAVRLLMRTKSKQDIYAWFHEPDQMRLEAGETMMFSTRLNGPPLGVSDIHLKFTDRRKQQAKLN